MAPLKKRQKTTLAAALPAAVIDAADCISRLPEDIQAHILSFLPAQEAVRTCVLARTWRHVWRFTRRLLITGKSVGEVRKFAHRLLRVRLSGLKRASLGASEIRFDQFVEVDDDRKVYLTRKDMGMGSINSWIRRVLKCQIQTLRVDISAKTNLEVYLRMSTTPLLVSPHLTRLELTGILFTCRCLNLDECPSLEQLEINNGCFLEDVRNITSLSVKRLVITSCVSYSHIQICVPRLVSLWLHNDKFKTSLRGLAKAKDLVLIADHKEDIFGRWCPTFSKLRTLVLNDDCWCQPDCSALACILEHAPRLEKLTLISRQWLRSRGKYKVQMKGHPDATVKSTKISQRLKVVEINCEDVNERFLNAVNFLGTLNIYFDIRVAKN